MTFERLKICSAVMIGLATISRVGQGTARPGGLCVQRTSLICFHAVSRWARNVESALTLRHVCVSVSCLLALR